MFSKAKRKRELINALVEEGLGFLVYELRLVAISLLPNHLKSKLKKKADRDLGDSIVATLQRLGGIFVKSGQFLSTRPDLIPYQFTTYLSKLQDTGLQIEYSDIEKIIRKNFGKDIVEIFRRFDKKPVSSASIGQVHFAILNDGTKVAVKIRRPNIKRLIQIDLSLLRWLVRKINKHSSELAKYNLDKAVNELSRWSKLEVNYKNEAQNMNQFYDMLAGSKYTIVPRAKMDLTTEEVLVMDWMAGRKITEFNRKEGSYEIAKRLTDSVIEQYIVYGTFHGDPHPGNIFVSNDNKIIFLDFGIIGHISEDYKKSTIVLLSSLISNDCETLTKEMIKLNLNNNKIPYGKFYDTNQHIIDDYNKKKIVFSEVFYHVIINAVDNHIDFPLDFILLAKSVITVDQLVKGLNPHFDINKEFEDLLKKGKLDFSVSRYINRATSLFSDIVTAAGVPKESRNAVKHIAKDLKSIVGGFLDKIR